MKKIDFSEASILGKLPEAAPDMLSNLQITLDKTGKVVTVHNVSTGKVLMIHDGENSYSLIPGGSLSFTPGQKVPRYSDEDDREYGDCHD